MASDYCGQADRWPVANDIRYTSNISITSERPRLHVKFHTCPILYNKILKKVIACEVPWYYTKIIRIRRK